MAEMDRQAHATSTSTPLGTQSSLMYGQPTPTPIQQPRFGNRCGVAEMDTDAESGSRWDSATVGATHERIQPARHADADRLSASSTASNKYGRLKTNQMHQHGQHHQAGHAAMTGFSMPPPLYTPSREAMGSSHTNRIQVRASSSGIFLISSPRKLDAYII